MCRSVADGGRRCNRPDHEQARQRRLRAARRHTEAQQQLTALIGATPFRPESGELMALSSRPSYYESDEWAEWSDRIQILAERYNVDLVAGCPHQTIADGLWMGEEEPSGSYLAIGRAEDIDRWAGHIAGHYNQDAVMVLHAGGPDVLYTFDQAPDAGQVLEAMQTAGIPGGRLVDGTLEIVSTKDAPVTDEALNLIRLRLGCDLDQIRKTPVTARFITANDEHRQHTPIKELQWLRQRHAERYGLPPRGPAPHLTDLDDITAAQVYQHGEHEPQHPRIRRSYGTFISHITEQYDELTAAGYSFEPWTSDSGQPYANSAEMLADLRDRRHLWFYRTETSQHTDGALPLDHPMARSVTVHDTNGHVQHMVANDVFRAVHDAIAHSEGHQFGPAGERAAWWAHRSSLPRQAHLALWNETRGQNAWTNAGPHMQVTTADGSKRVLRRGEPGWLPIPARPYAQQKCVNAPAALT